MWCLGFLNKSAWYLNITVIIAINGLVEDKIRFHIKFSF